MKSSQRARKPRATLNEDLKMNPSSDEEPMGLKEKASQTLDRAMHSKPVKITIESLSGAGQALAAGGRGALMSGKSLMGGLADLSVLLGLASGVGVWWLMHEASSTVGDVEIKSSDNSRLSLMNRVQDNASQILDTVSESASQVSNGAMQRVQGALGEIHGAVNKNPMAYLAGGLLVGGLLSILLPQSGLEGRVLGGARDRVVDTAESALEAGMKLAEGEVVASAVSAVASKLS